MLKFFVAVIVAIKIFRPTIERRDFQQREGGERILIKIAKLPIFIRTNECFTKSSFPSAATTAAIKDMAAVFQEDGGAEHSVI